MRVSVVIPTYNSSRTISETLESVLSQTAPADEVLVLDDGSIDDTVSILTSYEPRITVLRQANQGVASARNKLCKHAQGDLIAFLDHDDLWHPRYLEVQRGLFERYPQAAAFFTGHLNIFGHGAYRWKDSPQMTHKDDELLQPLAFLRNYNAATGPFGSMSYCCVPKSVLEELGDEPFRLSGVDDSYLCTALPLLGRPVCHLPSELVAYRITEQAQSTNKLKAFYLWIQVFELLEHRYAVQPDRKLRHVFQSAFAAKRRSYAKILMGAGDVPGARRQVRKSSRHGDLVSRAKSLALLASTFMPSSMQPAWSRSLRVMRPSADKTFCEPAP